MQRSEKERLVEELTERETEVLRLMAAGHRNERMAEALDITEQTVKEHIKHIMQKTKSTTRTGILAQIFRS